MSLFISSSKKITLFHDFKAFLFKVFGNKVYVLVIFGFHFYSQEATVYAFGVALFIVNTGYVAA